MKSFLPLALELAPNRTRSFDIFLRWGLLEREYNGPGRYYHVLDHIRYGYEKHLKHFGRMDAETFFTWAYHDKRYDARSHENEKLSADDFLTDNEVYGFSAAAADRIYRGIMSTTHTGEKNLITDLDLVGLGGPSEFYDMNTANIRLEYAHVSDADWKAGRSEFIERFLRTPIYFTPEFQQYQKPAEENLRRELRKLNEMV